MNNVESINKLTLVTFYSFFLVVTCKKWLRRQRNLKGMNDEMFKDLSRLKNKLEELKTKHYLEWRSRWKLNNNERRSFELALSKSSSMVRYSGRSNSPLPELTRFVEMSRDDERRIFIVKETVV